MTAYTDNSRLLFLAAFEKPNDICSDALIVPPNGLHQMVDLRGATADRTANGGACDGITIGDTPGLWFAVEGTGQKLRASTCHPRNPSQGQNYAL